MAGYVYVITEGLTERLVGQVLYARRLLKGPRPILPKNWEGIAGADNIIRRLQGNEGFLENLRADPEFQRILLIFDQEAESSPRAKANEIAKKLRWDDPDGFWKSFSFQPIEDIDNLFEHQSDKLHMILHISSIGHWKDFDGYILQLLQGSRKEEIARALTPQGVDPRVLLRKAERELTDMMNRNGFPWTHAKSWLYAYITVFQFRQSHVRFAERVVQLAPEDELRRVFAFLIEAWNRLATSL